MHNKFACNFCIAPVSFYSRNPWLSVQRKPGIFFKFLYKCIEIIKVLLQILTAPEAYFFCSF